MPHRDAWETRFKIWIERLMPDPGWDIQLVADRSIEGHRRAETFSLPANRTATIRYNPEIAARNDTACHEVLHVVLGGLALAADNAADELSEQAARMCRMMLSEGKENAVEMLTLAFLKAYEEEER